MRRSTIEQPAPNDAVKPPSSPRPLRNVLANWSAYLFGAVANFFLAPFVVHSLGNTSYGAWALLGSLVGYMGLLDLGVRGAVTRFVARFHAMADHREAERVASAGLVLFCVTSTMAIAGGVLLAFTLDSVFSVPAHLLHEARIAVILSATAVALALLNGVFGGIVTAMQRFDLNSSIEMSMEALRIIAVVVALKAGYGLAALAAIQLGVGVIRLGVSFVLSRRLYPELRISMRAWDRSHLRQVLGFSLAATGLQGASLVINQLDAVVIGAFLPVAMIAFFAVASNLMQSARAAVDGIAHTIPPRISALEGHGAMDGVHRTTLIGGRIASLVHIPIVLTLMLRGETFMGLWMGPDYAEPSGQILRILSLAFLFLAGRQILATSLMGLNRHRVLVPVAWLEAAVNVTLSIALVSSFGIAGVAWGTTVPSVAFTVTAYPIAFGRVLGIPIRQVWTNLWLRPGIALIPFALTTLVIERLWSPDSLFAFFAQVALALPIALAGAWRIGLSHTERILIRNHLPRPFRAVHATGMGHLERNRT